MAIINDQSDLTSYALLQPELLQVVGSRLSTEELRNARLVCTGWATALAHCMPAVTVALPRQASDRIFRQPLVLCSSGVLNSAQCQDYSAVPRSCQHAGKQPVLGVCRRRSSRNSVEGCVHGACHKRACTDSSSHSGLGLSPGPGPVQDPLAFADPTDGAEAQPVSRDKPSPFATELGQAVLDCLMEDPIKTPVTAGSSMSGLSRPHGNIMQLPRAKGIKAAISMPPTLAEQAAAVQQQQAMQADEQHMRKLSSVPAGNTHVLPRTRRVSKQETTDAHEQQVLAAAHPTVLTTGDQVIQGWSSLPTAGLRTCSSLKQLHLKLSGAPPSPADILDLSKLLHLTHLSFKQVDVPDEEEMLTCETQQGCLELVDCDTAGCSSHAHTSDSADSEYLDALGFTSTAADMPAASYQGAACAVKRSNIVGRANLQPGMMLCSGSELAVATASALECCHIHSPLAAAMAPCVQSSGLVCAEQQDSQTSEGLQRTRGPAQVDASVTASSSSSAARSTAATCRGSHETGCDVLTGAAAARDQGTAAALPEHDCVLGVLRSGSKLEPVPTHSITCSVITVEHVLALAQLPHLSSLELAPKHGTWDAAGREGLLHLAKLTALTRLSITWGDAAASTAPLSSEDAAAAAQGDQLPLQQCLAGLTGLQELSVNGAAVVDVAVLQRLRQLQTLTAQGLQVVNSDVMALIDTKAKEQLEEADAQTHTQQQQQAGDGLAPAGQQHQLQPMLSSAAHAAAHHGGPDAAAPAAIPAATQQQQSGRWASLPHLRCVHVVHPASDISLLLQSTVTPQLSHLGFVSRGPSDFARLLGQHGKLRALHLSFAEEESWHPIAVVRLPTALPSLQSLTIEGRFWLPNSLIVALGVMDVPLEHLSLTCRLAPPCLQRLQHLKQLKRLALHHVPAGPGTPAAPNSKQGKRSKGINDAMLQLPAKLLPPQLQELEISNGWILH